VAKVREIRDLGEVELMEKLESLKEELFNLRFQLATGSSTTRCGSSRSPTRPPAS